MPNSNSQIQIQTQKQRLSQKQILLTQMLDIYSDAELEEVVNHELEENPALEMQEEHNPEADIIPDDYNKEEEPTSENDWDNEARLQETTHEVDPNFYDPDADTWEPKSYQRSDNNDEGSVVERTLSVQDSSIEYLAKQIDDMFLSEKQNFLAKYLVGCLNEHGFLTDDLTIIANNLYIMEDVRTTTEELRYIVDNVLKRLEPTGVGTSGLQECLILQVERKMQQGEALPLSEKILTILKNHFGLLSERKFADVRKKMQLSEDEWNTIQKSLSQLTPHPLAVYNEDNYITPDFNIACDDDDKLTLSLTNEYQPNLHVSPEYEQMCATFAAMREKKRRNHQAAQRKELAESEKYVKNKIEKAQNFIDALSERKRTLYIVMDEILKQQHDYFVTGDRTKIQPMVLRDVGDNIGMDVSTVSRATSQRYAQTPFGIISVKSLFSEATNKENGISSIKIKDELKKLIDSEDKRKPYTDEQLAKILTENGYDIARRTVNLYRTEMNIPPKKERCCK